MALDQLDRVVAPIGGALQLAEETICVLVPHGHEQDYDRSCTCEGLSEYPPLQYAVKEMRRVRDTDKHRFTRQGRESGTESAEDDVDWRFTTVQ